VQAARLIARAAAVERPRAGGAPSPVRGLPTVAAVEGVTGPVPLSPLESLPPGDDNG